MARLSLALLLSALTLAACAPRLQSVGPLTGTPRIEPGALVARDGARLPLRRWGPEARKPWAAIAALHGFNDYSKAFDAAAKAWAAKGIVTYAIDQRGFGRAPQPGLWAGVEAMVSDAKALTAAVRARHPGLPLYVLGDSMGGAVAMVAFARNPAPAADGAILAAPAVWGRAHLGALKRGALWLTAHTIPWFEVTPEGLDIEPSDNEEMLRALARDDLIIKHTRVDAIWGLVNLMDRAAEAAAKIDVPLLLLYGAKDEVIPKAPTKAVLRTLLARGRARAAYYENGYHMLLRDLRARAVVDDVAAWIRDRRTPLPSGAEADARAWLDGGE